MARRSTVFMAQCETRHFDFVAFGKSKKEVLDVLAEGWRQHCRSYGEKPRETDDDPGEMYSVRLIVDDASVREYDIGACYCDGWKIFPKEEKAS